MSLLILQLPPRVRPAGQDRLVAALPDGSTEYPFVLTGSDGSSIVADGECAAALLPQATSVVAVLGELELAFHPLTCPKAPAARLRAALAGLLEERLLDEPEALHLALAPESRAGNATWVAACDRGWLEAHLQALERQGIAVDRVAPIACPTAPGERGQLHVQAQAQRRTASEGGSSSLMGAGDLDEGWITFCHEGGVATWPLSGSAGTALWPQPLPEGWRLSASPSSAEAAQRRLGQTVQIRTQAERLLAAAQNGWNLRQFDLATRHRGVTWLREAWLRLRSPQWRPIRWGLAALALVQVVGLNAWAWRQQQDLRQRRDEMLSLLRSAHPQVRAVLDAPVQMRRETELLRAGAGRSGPTDLEPMLRSAAAAWPENLPVQAIRYENQQLSLAAPGLGAPQADALRQRLAPAGWQVEGSDGRITLKRREGGLK